MKKKVIAGLGLSAVIVAGVAWSLLREAPLPEPSPASLSYVEAEFDGLTLEESVAKIRLDKERYDFFTSLGGSDDLYKERTRIPASEEHYQKGYSILTAAEYQQALNEVIDALSFRQEFYPGYSLIIFSIKDMPSKQQPSVTIKKITYMDGSDDIRNEKLQGSLRLDHNKTVKNITAEVKYGYITALASYHLTTESPEIIGPEFTLKLTQNDKNFLSYSLDGKLDIGGEDMTDKSGNILSSSSCVRGNIHFGDKMHRLMNDMVTASKKYSRDKAELMHHLAAYYERFEQETDEPDTYRVSCLLYGTPVAVTVYGIQDKAKETRSVVINPPHTDLYPVIEDENTKTFYLIDQNGQTILNYGKNKPYSLAGNYFFTRTTKSRKNDNGEVSKFTGYQLYKLDAVNKKANLVTEMSSVFSVSDDAFAIGTENEIILFNTMNEKPLVIPGKDLSIRTIEFPDGQSGYFYYADKQGYHVMNDKGARILPVAEYEIKNGGNNALLFAPGFFAENHMATADKRFYFLNTKGDIFLTLSGYDKAGQFIDNRSHVERNDRHGFADMTGRDVIPLVYENARDFDHGHALVKKDGHWGVINLQGEVVVPFKYTDHSARSSSNGLVSYEIDNKSYTMEELLKANGL